MNVVRYFASFFWNTPEQPKLEPVELNPEPSSESSQESRPKPRLSLTEFLQFKNKELDSESNSDFDSVQDQKLINKKNYNQKRKHKDSKKR